MLGMLFFYLVLCISLLLWHSSQAFNVQNQDTCACVQVSDCAHMCLCISLSVHLCMYWILTPHWHFHFPSNIVAPLGSPFPISRSMTSSLCLLRASIYTGFRAANLGSHDKLFLDLSSQSLLEWTRQAFSSDKHLLPLPWFTGQVCVPLWVAHTLADLNMWSCNMVLSASLVYC